eukprot:gene1532-61_t
MNHAEEALRRDGQLGKCNVPPPMTPNKGRQRDPQKTPLALKSGAFLVAQPAQPARVDPPTTCRIVPDRWSWLAWFRSPPPSFPVYRDSGAVDPRPAPDLTAVGCASRPLKRPLPPVDGPLHTAAAPAAPPRERVSVQDLLCAARDEGAYLSDSSWSSWELAVSTAPEIAGPDHPPSMSGELDPLQLPPDPPAAPCAEDLLVLLHEDCYQYLPPP